MLSEEASGRRLQVSNLWSLAFPAAKQHETLNPIKTVCIVQSLFKDNVSHFYKLILMGINIHGNYVSLLFMAGGHYVGINGECARECLCEKTNIS